MSLNILGENLKYLREQRGWSQTKACTKLYVSRSLLSILESGKQDLPYRKLKIFGKVYNVDIIDLMETDLRQVCFNNSQPQKVE